MARQIPKDTKTFRYYNANPQDKFVSDCVVRALCTALGQDWDVTLRELTEVGIECCTVLNDTVAYSKYLKDKGWIKHRQPRKGNNRKFTGNEFCKMVAQPNKTYIAHIGGGHVVCIKNKQIYDNWDSSEYCIGNYWTEG